MPTYLITYDLLEPGRDYNALYSRIESYDTWAAITESTWAVNTTQSAVAVRDNLASVMDSNDKLFVVNLGNKVGESAWQGMPNVVTEWLKAN